MRSFIQTGAIGGLDRGQLQIPGIVSIIKRSSQHAIVCILFYYLPCPLYPKLRGRINAEEHTGTVGRHSIIIPQTHRRTFVGTGIDILYHGIDIMMLFLQDCICMGRFAYQLSGRVIIRFFQQIAVTGIGQLRSEIKERRCHVSLVPVFIDFPSATNVAYNRYPPIAQWHSLRQCHIIRRHLPVVLQHRSRNGRIIGTGRGIKSRTAFSLIKLHFLACKA